MLTSPFPQPSQPLQDWPSTAVLRWCRHAKLLSIPSGHLSRLWWPNNHHGVVRCSLRNCRLPLAQARSGVQQVWL